MRTRMSAAVAALLSITAFFLISPWVVIGLFYILVPYTAWIMEIIGGW